jgi:glycine/D-amino acid oxidase-like deaminating enzyme
MRARVLIVGQGLAGSMLAWACERAGVDFQVADAGHATAASRVGAGIINPITGMRLVKSWRIDDWRDDALAAYRDVERATQCQLVRTMRVRRIFQDGREREAFSAKEKRAELAPYVSQADGEGCWIDGAAQVDLPGLIRAMRTRLAVQGRLLEQRIAPAELRNDYEIIVLCTGAALRSESVAGWEKRTLAAAKGQLLHVELGSEAAPVDPEIILNRGHWFLPFSAAAGKVGATFERGCSDQAPTAPARSALERSARALLSRDFTVHHQEVGVRLTTCDRHPFVGRDRSDSRIGHFNGLGSKGALLAPALAQAWVRHLTAGEPFEPDVAVDRLIDWP